MTAQVDLPEPYAGPVIAVLVIAVCYLALVDWTHPGAATEATHERTRT